MTTTEHIPANIWEAWKRIESRDTAFEDIKTDLALAEQLGAAFSFTEWWSLTSAVRQQFEFGWSVRDLVEDPKLAQPTIAAINAAIDNDYEGWAAYEKLIIHRFLTSLGKEVFNNDPATQD